ncbi:hypothetical protein SDRG_14880 [Saprolegnia diclina VS20]|uniref:Histone-lysine N-methyltransferase, H3 lysine-79 specific n=1 Tax=Saprolegnia diclina (strain VS20) TaxID=1156394 RepID=T0R599_SAPDV|nr:hypothetical protein SDRG_14880 [Saprolegnia diclina VS20]EQC27258.1 hypothetical protein SDRG_14880 [Saprolegnia diclina VS20]|eukprot:XP_008619261.1 hypothetical protein SDRG_14880 [Saprolegnia diclina VS20]
MDDAKRAADVCAEIRARVLAGPDGHEAKLLLLASLLHRHGLISSIGKSLLKELLFQHDVRGRQLVDAIVAEEVSGNAEPAWRTRTRKLIDIETFKLFDSLYLDCPLEKGKDISRKDREEQELLHEKSLVYGEVDYHAFLDVLSRVPIRPGDTFYDLGSGTGRAVFLARLNFDFAKCVGIELLQGLHEAAAEICRNYTEFVQPTISTTSPQLAVAFFHSSFLDLDWSHADVCFANSTCFDALLLQRMSAQAERLRPGAYLITFTKPLDSTAFDIIFKQRYSMSWGPATVYLHQRL